MAQFAVESVLEVPPAGAPLEVQQSYLKLLTEAFRRTHAFADKLVDIAGSTSVNTQARAGCRTQQGWTVIVGGRGGCRSKGGVWAGGRLSPSVPTRSSDPPFPRIACTFSSVY